MASRLASVAIPALLAWAVPLGAVPLGAAPLGATPSTGGADRCDADCDVDVACWRQRVDCWLAAHGARAAVDQLKPLVSAHPERSEWALLLARAYLADGNSFWAQRTLFAAGTTNDDCRPDAWLAWIQIRDGDLDSARSTLADAECRPSAADEARWHLLAAYAARLEEKPEAARDHLSAFAAAPQAHGEDLELWRSLRARDDPGFIEPLSLRLLGFAGYTSNGEAGSPTDPAATGSASGLARVDLYGRFVYPLLPNVRPMLEAGVKGHGLADGAVDQLSFMELSLRPGVLLGREYPRLFVGYHVDLMLMNDDDRGFYEGHRGELDFELSDSLTVLFGSGYRIYREAGRSRFELDGGIGWSTAIDDWGRLLLVGAVRVYDALGDPYDQVGTSLIGALQVRLPAGAYARTSVTLGADSYFNSRGRLGMAAYGSREPRFDASARLLAGLWSPPILGVRLGARYELGLRDSTADSTSDNYDYVEHRALAGVRWSGDFDPWAPGVSDDRDGVPLGYGVDDDRGAIGDRERIQDLLRQDEAARRGSSCVN